MSNGELNLTWAREIFRCLVGCGLEEVQIAPGSRSAPLVLALRSFPALGARVHLDERSAGFFATGYGRRRRRPTAVITTSGTAVANLLPSVVEADASDIPLYLLTADRPPRQRGADCNQTIEQVGIFGPRVRFEADLPLPAEAALSRLTELVRSAARHAIGPPGGPVHLNVPFDKPLQPEGEWLEPAEGIVSEEPEDWGAGGSDVPPDLDAVQELLEGSRRPVLVAGPSNEPDSDGPAVARFAERTGVPVLADPLSGARFSPYTGDGVIGGYDHFLGVDGMTGHLRPDVVIRVGRTPTSRALEEALVDWSDARQVVVDRGSKRKDHQGLAERYVSARPDQVLDRITNLKAPPEWARDWREVEDATWAAIRGGGQAAGHEGALAAAVLEGVPEGATLFVSGSMPVRDVDGYARPEARDVRILGNRGASGIDGIVSSALGCAAAGGEPVVALLGDLAFYHDMNGLLAARDEGLAVVFVIVDNDGGGIFHLLPIRAFEPAFTPYFATPHGLDFAHAARLYGLPFRDVSGPEELTAAVSEAAGRPGSEILRVVTDREDNRLRHEETRRRVELRLNDIITKEHR